MELLEKLKAAKEALDSAKAAEKAASAAYKALQEQAIEYFVNNDLQSMKYNGYTFFQYLRPWVSIDLSMPGAKEALQEAGIDYLVKESVNTTSLSSWYKEQQELGLTIPESLMSLIAVKEDAEVRLRKA